LSLKKHIDPEKCYLYHSFYHEPQGVRRFPLFGDSAAEEIVASNLRSNYGAAFFYGKVYFDSFVDSVHEIVKADANGENQEVIVDESIVSSSLDLSDQNPTREEFVSAADFHKFRGVAIKDGIKTSASGAMELIETLTSKITILSPPYLLPPAIYIIM